MNTITRDFSFWLRGYLDARAADGQLGADLTTIKTRLEDCFKQEDAYTARLETGLRGQTAYLNGQSIGTVLGRSTSA